MNPIVKFFHELINPHCTHCLQQLEVQRDLEYESRRCTSCESLQLQLAYVNEQNKNLIEKAINPYPVPSAIPVAEQVKPIHRGRVPFPMIRRVLEEESRGKAAALRNAAKPDSTFDRVESEAAQTNGISELEDLVLARGLNRETEVGTKQS